MLRHLETPRLIMLGGEISVKCYVTLAFRRGRRSTSESRYRLNKRPLPAACRIAKVLIGLCGAGNLRVPLAPTGWPSSATANPHLCQRPFRFRPGRRSCLSFALSEPGHCQLELQQPRIRMASNRIAGGPPLRGLVAIAGGRLILILDAPRPSWRLSDRTVRLQPRLKRFGLPSHHHQHG